MSKIYWKESSISVVECVFGPSIESIFSCRDLSYVLKVPEREFAADVGRH